MGVPDIVETAISAGNFTGLVEALQTAGLVDALKGAGPFTVFAPTDAAFTALLDSLGVTKAELLARDDLADILKYHVLSGSSVMSADLADAQDVTTLEGSDLTVTKDGSTVMAGSAIVSTADISCSNGVIHAIDSVLLPPERLLSPVLDIVETAISAGNFTVLVEALQTAGLADALKEAGPFTVFAPTDAAFTALLDSLGVTKAEVLARDDLADILKYHVLSGSSVMSADLAATQDVTTLEGSTLTVTKEGSTVKAGSATVSAADIACSNGVIHVIDAVLLPPVPDIVETAISAGSFTVLVEALQTAGLVDALKGAGPFTVFAPTDAAFTNLLDSLGVTKAELLARDDLADILKYHVLPGSSVMSADLAAAQDVTTYEGSNLTVTKEGSTVKAGSASVITPDIESSNGVIHVIDAVLLPPVPDIVETAISAGSFTVLVGALQTAGLVD